jgi:D-amino peptidase
MSPVMRLLSRRMFSAQALLAAGGWAAGVRRASADAKRPLKVYIFADMEGVSGITHSGQTLADGAAYGEGCRLMEADINACVAGCFDAGATEVTVRDGHGRGNNVDPARVDPRARLVQGPTPGVRFGGFEGSAALILLGYHAKALTPEALLAHSYSSLTIQGMWLNGREAGEIGVDTAIAAEHGVPVVMVSGCDKAVAEAREWIPGVVTVQTKRSTGVQSAVCLPLELARRMIREKAAEAVRRRQAIAPVAVAYPVTLRMDFLPQGSLRTYDPAFTPTSSPRRVERTGDSVEKLLLNKN